MKRGIFVLLITAIGICLCVVDAFYGVVLYTWHSLGKPQNIIYGYFRTAPLSFWTGLLLMASTAIQRHRILVASPITFFSLLFLAACFCSLCAPLNRSFLTVWSQLEVLFKVGLIALVIPVVVDNLQRLRIYIIAVAYSIAPLSAYYGIFGLFAGSINISGHLGRGQNNEFAAIVCAVLPYFFFAAGRFRPIIIRVINCCIFIGCLLALALAMSRGTYLAMAIVLPLLFIRFRNRSVTALVCLIFVPCCLIFLVRTYSELSGTGGRQIRWDNDAKISKTQRAIQSIFQEAGTMEGNVEDDDSMYGRVHFWKVGVNMFLQNPFFGIGYNQFEREFDRYDFLNGRFGRGRAIHNIYFQTLAETGLFGTISFLLTIAFCFIAQSKAKRIAKMLENKEARDEILDYTRAVRISSLSLAITSIFLTSIKQPVIWLIPTISIILPIVALNELKRERSE